MCRIPWSIFASSKRLLCLEARCSRLIRRELRVIISYLTYNFVLTAILFNQVVVRRCTELTAFHWQGVIDDDNNWCIEMWCMLKEYQDSGAFKTQKRLWARSVASSVTMVEPADFQVQRTWKTSSTKTSSVSLHQPIANRFNDSLNCCSSFGWQLDILYCMYILLSKAWLCCVNRMPRLYCDSWLAATRLCRDVTVIMPRRHSDYAATSPWWCRDVTVMVYITVTFFVTMMRKHCND
jgi:hypothetical protein